MGIFPCEITCCQTTSYRTISCGMSFCGMDSRGTTSWGITSCNITSCALSFKVILWHAYSDDLWDPCRLGGPAHLGLAAWDGGVESTCKPLQDPVPFGVH